MFDWKKIAILVVDDEEFIRDMIRDEFSELGATVCVADGVKSAKDCLARIQFDMVLTDVRMPDEDGISLLRYIRTNTKPLPLLFLCTGFSQHTQKDVAELNVAAVFNKPFKWSHMISTMEACYVAKKERKLTFYKIISDRNQYQSRNPWNFKIFVL